MTKTFKMFAVAAFLSVSALSAASAADDNWSYVTQNPKVGVPIATFNAPDTNTVLAEKVADLFDEIADVRSNIVIGGVTGNDRARGKIVVLARKVKAMQYDATVMRYPEDIVQALNSAAMRVKDIQVQIDTGYDKLREELQKATSADICDGLPGCG